ncbi:NAD(P)/FAD-dependent oxidoreductase [Marinomonas pollencensis]|uniref:D-amino-acid dehydrogenase n=1 Tax=Marinomonas pollencensis TaxID=491954 RepID=A0A3E0DQ41_9GAMM|nr:FAD-binding oxidoreductase [Marinomonas pollencensis]REG85040.1 D-amino-acid dehydrogenase [Marinomonas pollencensis]
MAEFLVLGAGMVGVSSALALQAAGHTVTLVDRIEAGCETSYGNAGIIQAEAAEPHALPRHFMSLLNYAFERGNDVTWRLDGLLQMAPALLSYFRQSSAARHSKIAHVYSQLTSRSTTDHEVWICDASAEHLIQRNGFAMFYRTAEAFDDATQKATFLTKEYGVISRIIEGKDYRVEEPMLQSDPVGVVNFEQNWSCRSPGDLTKAYADLFVSRGGRFVFGEANSLQQSATGWRVMTEAGELSAEQVVIALGPWSPELLKRFGYYIPMIYKRGYHGHFTSPTALTRPLMDVENGVVASAMTSGLRVTSGAALVPMTAPLDTRQLDRGAKALSDILPLGGRVIEPQWVGTRPCMPGMLPLVGAAPKHKGLWFNFGHGHQGFTLGPTTAELLAKSIAGEESALLSALAPKYQLG